MSSDRETTENAPAPVVTPVAAPSSSTQPAPQPGSTSTSLPSLVSASTMLEFEPHESKSLVNATSEKFDGKDFTDWKFEMLRALEVAGLQDMVLGNEVEPNDPVLLRK